MAFCRSHRTYSSSARVTASRLVLCPPSWRAASISLSSRSRFVATACLRLHGSIGILHNLMCKAKCANEIQRTALAGEPGGDLAVGLALEQKMVFENVLAGAFRHAHFTAEDEFATD